MQLYDMEKLNNQIKESKIKELKAIKLELMKYTKIDADIIGSALAKLLTTIEDVNFIYTTPKFVYTDEIWNNKGKIKKLVKEIPFRVVIPTFYYKEIYTKRNEIYKPTVVIDKNQEGYYDIDTYKKQINLYTDDFDINFNKPFDNSSCRSFMIPSLTKRHHKFIKEFVDKVTNYRIQNDVVDIRENEVNILLDAYIKNIKEPNKVKKLS